MTIKPEDHIGLLVMLLKGYLKKYPKGTNLKDTSEWSDGLLGLIKACKLYDKSKKTNFSTFAAYCIRSQIRTTRNSNTREQQRIVKYIEQIKLQPKPINIDDINWLLEVINNLPYKYKTILKLTLKGKPIVEISNVLNISISEVTTLKRYILNYLRRKYYD